MPSTAEILRADAVDCQSETVRGGEVQPSKNTRR
jgi:hypothetical protein